MHKIKISKRNGTYRTVYVPSKEEKEKLRSFLLIHLDPFCERQCGAMVHGFMRGRSPVTNALEHIGYSYSLSFDLKDFFDTVTPDKFYRVAGNTSAYQPECFVDGIAGQGLPTSPAIANIAATHMDQDLLRLGAKYTRYADDLTFSFHDREQIDLLKEQVPQLVQQHGFQVNPQKTKLQASAGGRRIITGISVGHTAIYPTRRLKRKLRAARHQGRRASARGLEEACKCRLPKLLQEKQDAMLQQFAEK